MSQPGTELATESGEESIEDIAGAMGAGDELEEDTELPDADAGDSGDDDVVQEITTDEDPEEEWEAGGQKYRVKRSELRAGYMKDSDYRKKTAEVAEQRRTYEAYLQQIAQERQNAATQLDVYLQALQKDLIGSQPDPKLIEEDPQEFLRQQAAYQGRAQQFQAALQHRQSVQGRIDADEQRKRQEWAKEQEVALLDKVPEWRNEASRKKESAEVAEYLTSLGYTQQDLNELIDHRAVLVARDAAKYRQLLAAKQKQAKPEIRNPVRPGAASGANTNSKAQRALDRLKRDPNSLDALGDFVGMSGI